MLNFDVFLRFYFTRYPDLPVFYVKNFPHMIRRLLGSGKAMGAFYCVGASATARLTPLATNEASED